MTLHPSVSSSMVLSPANITNGKLHAHKNYMQNIYVIISGNLNSNIIPALSPYIIGTSNQPVKMIANHGLHLSFRLVKGAVFFPCSIVLCVTAGFVPDYTEVRSEARCGVNKSIQ